jgi:hypothetical protein
MTECGWKEKKGRLLRRQRYSWLGCRLHRSFIPFTSMASQGETHGFVN